MSQKESEWEKSWKWRADRMGLDNDQHDEVRDFITTAVSQIENEIAEEVEKLKKNLVVYNWEDGKPQNCNPRCHDSGKEEVIDTVLSILKHQ